MTDTRDSIIATISDFWAYKPNQDSSTMVEPKFLFKTFEKRDNEPNSTNISTFASIAQCPYRIVNIGAGHSPRFSKSTIAKMRKGTDAHQTAERDIRQKAKESIGKGGPPDLRTASPDLIGIAANDLLEAPEAPVQLTVEKIGLRGKVDGLLRTDGLVLPLKGSQGQECINQLLCCKQ